MDKNKLIIIGILVAIIIFVTGALIYVTNTLHQVSSAKQGQSGENESSIPTVPIEQIQTFSISEPITANLVSNNEDEESHIIRLSVSVGMNTKAKDFKKIDGQVTEKTVIMRSDILALLKTKEYDEMIRPDAQEVLSQDILKILREKFQTDTFVEVYFGEFFVQ